MFQHAKHGSLILVADDNRDVRRRLQKLLEFHAYRVCTADDGQEVLAATARQAPDLILLDINMPRLDGLGALRALRADHATAHIPVILLTAQSGTSATVDGLDAGADEFVSKPVDEQELLARVRTLLRVKQQHDRLRDHQQRLTRLLHVTEQLRLRVAPDALLDGIANLACEHLGFQRVLINLLDVESGVLKVGAIAGVKDARTRAELAQTTYRWAEVRALLRPEYQIGESFLIPDEAANRRRNGRKPFLDRTWCAADNLLVPLRASDGTFLGLLSFDTPVDGLRPSAEQVQLLELFAHQAALALHNAALYADLHRHYGRYVAPAIAAELAGRTAPSLTQAAPVEVNLVVLFADLRGFTSLTEGLSPQVLVDEVLNPYFTRMTEVVHAYDGMVDKFLGDGVMALFGVPTTRPDDSARAITAGLAMQETFTDLRQTWQRHLDRDIGMGVGLAYGKAVVGTIGSPQRMDYTAIGTVVNIASRITDMTPSGEVWATGELKMLAETFVMTHPGVASTYPLAFRPLMPTTIKGASDTQPLYVCLLRR
ncbi:MAG TPA: response regulator [Chloroflexia bacterium]|nr:response regulator [Chloroflexia bacterium]